MLCLILVNVFIVSGAFYWLSVQLYITSHASDSFLTLIYWNINLYMFEISAVSWGGAEYHHILSLQDVVGENKLCLKYHTCWVKAACCDLCESSIRLFPPPKEKLHQLLICFTHLQVFTITASPFLLGAPHWVDSRDCSRRSPKKLDTTTHSCFCAVLWDPPCHTPQYKLKMTGSSSLSWWS